LLTQVCWQYDLYSKGVLRCQLGQSAKLDEKGGQSCTSVTAQWLPAGTRDRILVQSQMMTLA
jgi:hypothetical protein